MQDLRSDAAGVLENAMRVFYGDDKNRIEAVRKHPVVQVAAVLPFASLCENPAQLADSNLRKLFLAAKEKQDSALPPHKPTMTLRARLKPCDTFSTAGKPEVAEKGMLFFEWVSLMDHKKDLDPDSERQPPKYNPLCEPKAMDFEAEKSRILSQMKIIGPTEIDRIIDPVMNDRIDMCFWFC